MAKIKLGNVKGPKGDQGVRGSKWFNTANITGTSTSGTAFPNSGIASAMVGDMALNPTTLNLYICQTAGNAATAKWAFIACIKGPQGAKGDKGDPTTVDAVLSKDSTNPIQNKAVATKFQDVQDSLDRVVELDGFTSSSASYSRANNALCIQFTGEITASSGKTFSNVQLLANGAKFSCMGLNSQNSQWEPFL